MAEEKVVIAAAKAEEVKKEAEVKPAAKKAEKAAAEKKAPAKKAEKATAEKKTPAKKAEKAAAEKKTPAKKAEKAVAEKKAPAKKAEKKPAGRKPAAKANVFVQFAGKSFSQDELVKIAKDVWQYDMNMKVADFKSVEIYVKPEENMAYFVVNGDVPGSFVL